MNFYQNNWKRQFIRRIILSNVIYAVFKPNEKFHWKFISNQRNIKSHRVKARFPEWTFKGIMAREFWSKGCRFLIACQDAFDLKIRLSQILQQTRAAVENLASSYLWFHYIMATLDTSALEPGTETRSSFI